MARLFDVSIGKWDQFKRLLAEAGLIAEEIEAAIHQPDLIELMVQPLKERYVRYTGKLLSLEQQWELICRYNKQYWDGYFSKQDLEAYRPKLASDHEQSVTDLLVLHVEFDSLEETFKMWWKVFQGEQPEHWQWDALKLDRQHCALLSSNVATYPARTITRVRINLVSHWEPENGRTLEEVRQRVAESGETLAHVEVMSTYGLHAALFREQDGKNLPHSDLAGTCMTVPDESDSRVLCLGWNPERKEVGLGARLASSHHQEWAAPVIMRRTLS